MNTFTTVSFRFKFKAFCNRHSRMSQVCVHIGAAMKRWLAIHITSWDLKVCGIESNNIWGDIFLLYWCLVLCISILYVITSLNAFDNDDRTQNLGTIRLQGHAKEKSSSYWYAITLSNVKRLAKKKNKVVRYFKVNEELLFFFLVYGRYRVNKS